MKTMRKSGLIWSVLFYFVAHSTMAQNEITWSFTYNMFESQIEMSARLATGWHIYSTDLGGIAGPIPTEFEFTKNKHVTLIGTVIEPEPKVEFDPNFEETVKYFDDHVVFKQKTRWKGKRPTEIKGSVVYMICNDRMCLPPVEKKFVVALKK